MFTSSTSRACAGFYSVRISCLPARCFIEFSPESHATGDYAFHTQVRDLECGLGSGAAQAGTRVFGFRPPARPPAPTSPAPRMAHTLAAGVCGRRARFLPSRSGHGAACAAAHSWCSWRRGARRPSRGGGAAPLHVADSSRRTWRQHTEPRELSDARRRNF